MNLKSRKGQTSIELIIIGLILAFVALLIWIWKKVNPPQPPAKIISLVADKTSLAVGETINFNGVVLQQTTPPTPVPGAAVFIDVSGTSSDWNVVTDSSGSYAVSFTPSATGDYTVQASLSTGEKSEIVSFTRSQFERYPSLGFKQMVMI